MAATNYLTKEKTKMKTHLALIKLIKKIVTSKTAQQGQHYDRLILKQPARRGIHRIPPRTREG